jgi:hypothetical protein
MARREAAAALRGVRLRRCAVSDFGAARCQTSALRGVRLRRCAVSDCGAARCQTSALRGVMRGVRLCFCFRLPQSVLCVWRRCAVSDFVLFSIAPVGAWRLEFPALSGDDRPQVLARRRISSTSLSSSGCDFSRAWKRRVRFGLLSARERPSHSASSARVASVWRRHSQAATARAMWS